MQGVLQILRGEALSPEPDWAALLALARQEQVLPIVAHRLLLSGIPIPGDIRQQVALAQREATLSAFFWTSQLTILLREFAAARIDVIPLKGPFLAERIYGGTALRISRDLDLLVRPSDYTAAESLLLQLGFTPSARHDDYHRQWYRGGATIELHFDAENPLAIDFQILGAWEQSLPGLFHSQPCRALAPADELLFLCIHGVRHRFERLSHVLDIALALEAFAWRAPRREVAGLTRLLAVGAAMAKHLLPRRPIPAEIPAFQPMQQLADRLWQDLMQSAQPSLDWRSQHAFFLETELTPARRWLRRLAHVRIAANRLIEPDYEFAAQWGLHRRWQARLLRPIRLVFAKSRQT